MALAFTNRAAIANNVDGTTFATAAFTPSASAGILVALWNSKATTPDLGTLDTPSWLSGAWSAAEIDLVSAGTVRRLTVYSGFTVASPGSAALTATFGATQTGCVIVVDDVTGQDVTDFVLQPGAETEATGTSASRTLAGALAGADSAIWSACGNNINEAKTPTGGETELADVGTTAPTTNLQTQFKINATVSGVSWVTSTGNIVIGALEVKAAGAAVPRHPAMNHQNPALLAVKDAWRQRGRFGIAVPKLWLPEGITVHA